ncbi:hypothetical protein [Kangiella sp. M94]
MSQKGILIITLRIAAILLFISMMSDLGRMFQEAENFKRFGRVLDNNILHIGTLYALSLQLIVVVIFWFFPNILLSKISGLPKEKPISSQTDFMTPLVALLGLYFTLQALIDILSMVFHSVMSEMAGIIWFALAPSLVSLIVGLLLLFGRSTIVDFIMRFRKPVKKNEE